MSSKVAIAVVVGSSCTFTLVVGLMAIAMDLGPWSPTRQSRTQPMFEPPTLYEESRHSGLPQKRDSVLDVPTDHLGTMKWHGEVPEMQIDAVATSAAVARQTVSAAASKHLSVVQKDLKQQIVSLKKNRDQMLDELATELRMMTPEAAVDQLAILDDESAGMTLARLPKTKRKLILDTMNNNRARHLDRQARTLSLK